MHLIVLSVIVHEFCRRELHKSHIKKIENAYRKKRDSMLQAPEEYMPEKVRIDWTHPEGRLFLWVCLPEHLDAEKSLIRVMEKKVVYVIGSTFHFDRSGNNTMRLSFSYPSEEQIDVGIKRLAGVIKEAL